MEPPSKNNPGPLGTPFQEDAQFDTWESVGIALQAHAKAYGYALIKRDTRRDATSKAINLVIWVCNKAGKYDDKCKNKSLAGKTRQTTGSQKCECPHRVQAKMDKISGQWTVQTKNQTHNHGPFATASGYTQHRTRALGQSDYEYIRSTAATGARPSEILSGLRQKNKDVVLTPKDISNILQKYRREQLGGLTAIEWLVKVCSI
jgi:hypothetical protein